MCYLRRTFAEQFTNPSQVCVSLTFSGRYPQYGTLQTSCPHPTSWNSDLDSQESCDKTSFSCDYKLCNADDVKDEQHVLFHCTHPLVVSPRVYAGLLCRCFLTCFHNVPEQQKALFLPSCTLNSKASYCFFEQASALLDWRPFNVNPFY